MDSMMKSSLGAPLRQFTSCMSGTTNNQRDGKVKSVRRNSLFRRKSVVRRKSAVLIRRKSAPCTSQKVPDSWLRIYQADLQRERKLREARFKKRASERTVKSTQFRSQHCLRRSSNAKKPHKLAGREEGIAVFFKGLSLNVEGLKGKAENTLGPMNTGGDQCKVM